MEAFDTLISLIGIMSVGSLLFLYIREMHRKYERKELYELIEILWDCKHHLFTIPGGKKVSVSHYEEQVQAGNKLVLYKQLPTGHLIYFWNGPPKNSIKKAETRAIEGFNTQGEQEAYQTGIKHANAAIRREIESWKGDTTSDMGFLLHDALMRNMHLLQSVKDEEGTADF